MFSRTANNTFHGRARELDALEDALSSMPLVTLVGPGGVGKTRLARALLDRVRAGDTAPSTWFVDLHSAGSAEAMTASVAQALGIVPDPDRGPEQWITRIPRWLDRAGTGLLVLDNMEQLVEAAAPLLASWAQRCERTRFVVTSRAPLGIALETVHTVDALSSAAAVALFEDRASRLAPTRTFARAEVEAIVQAIDRLPLAIELAASRTRVLSLGELRQRLERPLRVLRNPARSGRHQSIRRTVLDSVSLLPAAQRDFFALVSVLKDGFRLEDAEAVFGTHIDGFSGAEHTLDAVDALARISLIVTDTGGVEARYGMLVTIREVAESLASEHPSRPQVRDAHMTYFAERARRQTLSRDDVENLLAAHAHALATRAVDAVLPLSLALDEALSAQGRLQQKHIVLRSTLDAVGDTAAHLVPLRLALGRAHYEVGDAPSARRACERALSEAPDGPLRAEALIRVASLDDVAGETNRARERLSEALERLDALPPSPRVTALAAEAQRRLGHAYRREGALARAEPLTRAAVAHARRTEDAPALAAALYESGRCSSSRARCPRPSRPSPRAWRSRRAPDSR